MMRDRLEVVPGPGTVLHYGRIVVWAGPSASPALIDFLVSSARNLASSPTGGSQMADHIARVLSSRDPEPAASFVTIGPDGPRWSVLMHGPVQLWDGTQWLAPSPSPGWLRSPLDPRPWAIVGPAGMPLAQPRQESSLDMESGSVTGSGFVFWPGDEAPPSAHAPRFPQREAAEEPASAPLPADSGRLGDLLGQTTIVQSVEEGPAQVGGQRPAEDPAQVQLRPGAPGGAIDLRNVKLERRPPLPAVRSAEEPDPRAPVVSGLGCPKGHFNPPTKSTCARCSTPIDPRGALQSDHRPCLGVLVCDDGAVYRLDSGYVLGRQPQHVAEVVRGSARPLVLASGGPELADAHAEVRLVEWTVELVDRGSGAATFVLHSGQDAWTRIAPGQSSVLSHGTHLAVGKHVITFLSRF